MNEITYENVRPDAVRDLSQTLATQQTAGPASTESLAQSFLARVQRDIDEQVDLRVQQQLATWKAPRASANEAKEVMLGSLGIGVGLTAVVGIFGVNIAVAIVAWVCILIVNVVWALAWLTRR